MATHKKSFGGSLSPGGEHTAAGANTARGRKKGAAQGPRAAHAETHAHKPELAETILRDKGLLDPDGKDIRDGADHYHEAPKPKAQRTEPRDWLIALQHKHKGYPEVLTDSKGQKTLRFTYGDGDVTAVKAPTVDQAIMKLCEKMGETTDD